MSVAFNGHFGYVDQDLYRFFHLLHTNELIWPVGIIAPGKDVRARPHECQAGAVSAASYRGFFDFYAGFGDSAPGNIRYIRMIF
jgi:hypothetical protein